MAFSSDTVRVFLAVLDHGSFSAAARALGRVPSAVSMAIGNLEAELDLALFDRGGREPVPTAAARALEPQARAIASGLRQLEAHALALHGGLERRLGLAIASELLSVAWSAPLERLAEEFPALEIEVFTGPMDDMMALLAAGDAQLALVFERPRVAEWEAFQEFSQELFVAVVAPGHPLIADPARRPRMVDLLDARQVATVGRDRSRTDPRLLLGRRLWRTDSHLATLGLVQAGLGWAFLPRTMAAPMIAGGTLVEIAFEDMTNELRLWVDVVWRNDRPLGLGARRYLALIGKRERIP
jgi:DNA-binding transcriptional LysR family regulator